MRKNQESEGCEGFKKNVIFVKTHKTASSSVQNILLRYTVNHGLNLAMPRHNGARFFNPEPFSPDMVRPFYDEDEQPNVIANHLVASPELFNFIPDAFTFTILRSVPSLYESTFEYFKTSTKAFKNAGNIDAFYSNPKEFYAPGSHYNEYTRNHMAHDLGFKQDSVDPVYFQKSVEYMERRFDLVLISDYFLESMILLQDRLCLTMDEVVTLVVNARDKNRLYRQQQLKISSAGILSIFIYSTISTQLSGSSWRQFLTYKNAKKT
ncbi:Oidioi.mRNA.OKI2018_I69.PAR.g12901.t1.cds [Oikopleura dioica]|uniref:Oidioi.mRNA.OKI2018_I69.PAR.g12901.t1.cds n=1 Tax=Oikopleura dioica TaxID=34765 RepID=A0ABN7S6Y3_OIKDI|nr:Oidioi.mRNA.OKI2018_I69.PAR.g12901.t1.cds [Oikopleura dioica]